MDIMMRRREMLKVSGGSSPSINDYVKNGIILWYDGIQNTPSGHDSTSEWWYDLSGNNVHYPYTSYNTIYPTYCDINGHGAQCVESSSEAIANNITNHVAFVELVIDLDGTGNSTQMVIGFGNVLGTTYIKSNSIGFKGNSNSNSISVSSGVHYYNSELYRDGEIQTHTNVSASFFTASFGRSDVRFLFAYNSETSYATQCNIYALRLYNRVLTASEIENNWLIDKARFGI